MAAGGIPLFSCDNDPVLKEQEHVHEVYSQIATHFSDTRYKPWPRIAEFLESLPSGSIVADIGCGNGKYLGVNRNVFMVGSDICSELVAIAKGRGHEVLISDCLSLPYTESVFDATICIAVLHHLSTEERRRAGIMEIARVLRPGGRALVYVWAMEQTKKKFASQDAMVPWHMQLKYLPGCEGLDQQPLKKKKKWRKKYNKKGSKHTSSAIDQVSGSGSDDDTHPKISSQSHETIDHTSSLADNSSNPTLLPSNPVDHTPRTEGFKTYYRYYHVFCDGELVRLCDSVPCVNVVDHWYDHDNWCVLIEKQPQTHPLNH